MPTGYTAPIHDGDEITFEDFALRCARNFGAFIMQRDEPMSTPAAPRFEPQTRYYDEQIEKATDRLALLKGWSWDETVEQFRIERERQEKRYQEAQEKDAAMTARYDGMIAQVEAWQPSERWRRLKAFMLEQLEESKRFDCGVGDYLKPKTWGQSPDEWRQAEIENAERDLARGRKSRQEEIDRTNERNEWAADLYASLGLEVSA